MNREQVLLEKRRYEARNLRYKKAICQTINLGSIKSFLWDAEEAIDDVTSAMENDDVFIEVMNGDEEEAFEFRMAFSTLSSDIYSFRQDLNDAWVPQCFDDFFASIGGEGRNLLGFDAYEGDYFGLSHYESSLAQEEAVKRMMRLTKKDLIEAAHQCFIVVVAYLGIRSRWEDLQSCLNIIRAKNDGILTVVKRIDELYNQAYNETFGHWKNDSEREFDQLIQELPDEAWIR